MKVLCHNCQPKGRIDGWRPFGQYSKEALAILENAKKCENCGIEFKDENEKVLVF